MLSFRKQTQWIAVSIAVVLLVAIQEAASAASEVTLRVAISADIATLDPHNSALAYDRSVMFQIFDPLVLQKPDLSFAPGLAESWSTPDNKTLVMKLRKGVKFHDGTAFDATAAKWNLDRILDKGNKLKALAELVSVDSISVVDPYTIQIKLKHADASILARLAERPGMMISPTAFQKAPDKIALTPVGTGAFKLVEWMKGDHITLQKNPDYWEKGLPKVDRVILRPIGDGTQRLMELTSGNVDLLDLIDPKDVQSVKTNSKVTYYETASTRFGFLAMNVKRPPLDKKEVRQAFAWAIDREAIAKVAYLGTATAAQGPFPPSFGWLSQATPKNAYGKRDVARAKQLLVKAGYPNGVKFSVNVINRVLDIQNLELMKAQAAEAGITIEIRAMDSTQAIQDATSHTHQSTFFTWSGRTDPDYQIYAVFVTNGGPNYSDYSNPQVDDLLNKARATYDLKERAGYYKQINELLLEDSPWLFTVYPKVIGAASKKVSGFAIAPDTAVRLRQVGLSK